MILRGPVARVIPLALLCGLAMAVGGCSLESPSPRLDAADTALPTPSPRATPPQQILGHRVGALLATPAVSVDEDLQTGAHEVEVRLSWSSHGSVVDSTALPIEAGSGPGYEVFRSPATLLQRPAGSDNPCWSPGGDNAARFDQPVVQEIAVLRSARAVSGQGDLLKGTVSARALIGVLGSPAQLQALGLDASATARVPATFATTGDALQVTLSWSSLAKAAGSSATSGTWLLSFRPFGTSGPTAPGADMMCP
jgi:hypothetical protein